MDFGLIYRNVKAASKIAEAVGGHQNISASHAIPTSLLINLNVFGNVLQENIALLLDIVSGASQDVTAALAQRFRIVCLALQTNMYLIMCALMINALGLHIWLILSNVSASNASLDVLFVALRTFAVFASQDTTYIKAGAISNALQILTLAL